MRLFIALELPVSVRADLDDRLAVLRRSWTEPKWVPGENWHLTLAFLGELPDGLAEMAGEVTASVARRHTPFSVELAGAGSFPPKRPARVLWVAMEPASPLRRLRDDLAAALDRANLPGGGEPRREGREGPESEPEAARPEHAHRHESGRPFHPHVTVARCRPPATRRRADRWCTALEGYRSRPFAVDALTLMESRLRSRAARYEPVRVVPLGGAR